MKISPIFPQFAGIAASLVLLSGCAEIGRLPAVGHIQDKIEALKIQLPTTASANQIDTGRFAACMAPLTERLHPGLSQLLTNAQKQSDTLLVNLGQLDEEFAEGHLFTQHPLVSNMLDHLLSKSVRIGPDDLLARLRTDLQDTAAALPGRVHANSVWIEEDAKLAAEYSKEYLLAYFKKGGEQTAGAMVQSKVELTELRQQAAATLKCNVDDPRVDKVVGLITSKLAKAGQKLEHKNIGFVGRDGTQYAFPGLLEESQHINIDHSQIATDTLRIVLEAIRDANAPLPVVANSSAANKLPNYAIQLEASESQTTVTWAYDKHAPDKAVTIKIDNADFQAIEAHGRRTEASVAGAVGKAIRGGSWGALNNEAVARLVETAAGVVARHVADRGQWCVKAQQTG